MFRKIQPVAWALIACLAFLAAPWPPAAEAHAELLSAYPAPGARLATTPTEIRLTFSERIGLGSSVRLFGPQFRPVSNVTSGLDPAAPEELRAFPPQLAPDIYTVEWNVASVDGHAVSGSYAFEVTAPAAAPATRAPVWLLVSGPLIVLVLGGVGLGPCAPAAWS
jgi:methionine-rich copper-binding protein CopC